MFKKNLLSLFLITFTTLFPYIIPTIILPFKYKNKKLSENQNEKLSYFESQLENTLYTTMKVYNQEIDFHISMERYPMYISDKIYKRIEDNNNPNKKEPAMLYSLDQIGIDRASLINKTIFVKSNYSSENEIKNINIFRTRKFTNVSDYIKNRMGYASEEAEIGFNIVRGSQYQYVEETENDIDDETIKEDYQKDKEREKAYEELYGLKNKTKKSDVPTGYDPMNEYNPDISDDDQNKKPYDDEELEDIYGDYYKKDNKSKTEEKKKENNNDKKEDKEKEKERYMGNGLFKEESANFITQLKKRDKINSYAFSIKYNNDDNGEIIIGDLPHEYSPDKYSSDNYFFDTVPIMKEPPFNWHFTYTKSLYGEEEVDKGNQVKLSIDFGFIKGNTNLRKSLEKNFFNVNDCHKNKVRDYDAFYCTKEAVEKFKPIVFELQSKYCANNANAKFEFTKDDLFIKDKNSDKDIYYFQIIFNNVGFFYNYLFGKPLFKKYQMVFDQDRKTFGFYLQSNNKVNNQNTIDNNSESDKNTSLKISWGIVIVLVIFSLGLLYALHKLFNKLPRKLKANELEENFSYEANNSKYNEITSSGDKKNQLYENVYI